MKWQIQIDKPAVRFLEKQPPKQQEKLLRAIYALPEQGDIKVMKGYTGLYRLRVGDYRVLYTLENQIMTVHVIKIGNRGDVYK